LPIAAAAAVVVVASSGDGSEIVMTFLGLQPIYLYDASDGSFSASELNANAPNIVSLSRTGADLTTVSNGLAPEIGSGTSLTDSPGTGAAMTITPDGGTLILAGNAKVIITPHP
jgi:hypothetical protein